jgi:hypothetical protein
MAMIVLVDGSGDQVERIITEGNQTAAEAGRNPTGMIEIVVDEWPDLWTKREGDTWVTVPSKLEASIDPAHLANHGPLTIRFAHLQKAIEAQLYLAGIDISHGLLAAEAEDTGIPISALAEAALTKSTETYNTLELARRQAKIAARNSG